MSESRLSGTNRMAVGVGFEPTIPFERYNSFQDCRLQPLGHPTMYFIFNVFFPLLGGLLFVSNRFVELSSTSLLPARHSPSAKVDSRRGQAGNKTVALNSATSPRSPPPA